MPAHSLLTGALCALTLLPFGETTSPQLDIQRLGAEVRLTVGGHDEIFVGAFLGSLEPTLQHYLTGLPPLLGDAVYLGGGIGYPDGGFVLPLQASALPPDVSIYVQGVTLTEAGIQATDVGKFSVSEQQIEPVGN